MAPEKKHYNQAKHDLFDPPQASTMKIRPAFQMTVLQEVVTWFDQPQLLVEMFVNFDMDRKFVSHWNVFSHLVSPHQPPYVLTCAVHQILLH